MLSSGLWWPGSGTAAVVQKNSLFDCLVMVPFEIIDFEPQDQQFLVRL